MYICESTSLTMQLQIRRQYDIAHCLVFTISLFVRFLDFARLIIRI